MARSLDPRVANTFLDFRVPSPPRDGIAHQIDHCIDANELFGRDRLADEIGLHDLDLAIGRKIRTHTARVPRNDQRVVYASRQVSADPAGSAGDECGHADAFWKNASLT